MSAIVSQKPSRGWLCCRESKDRYGFSLVLHSLDLTDVEKEIIQTRYLSMLENFQKRARQYASLFFVGHFIITVGSLFVPALLSIQNSSYATTHSEFGSQVYWLTFALSLMVTMCNGMITLFKVDKKYYFLNTTMERLRSEGWQYVGLTGRYSGHGITPTHQNQFLTFTHHIEKIKMKQVEEEYYKMQEKSETTPPGAPSSTAAIDLYPLSPDKPLSMMKQAIPGPVQDTVQSLLQSQEVDLRLIRGNTQALLLSDASSASASSASASSSSAPSLPILSPPASSPPASSPPASSSPDYHTSVTFLGDQGIGNDVSNSV
jgi:hypothetical protein